MDVWLYVCIYVCIYGWMNLERTDLNDSVFQAEQVNYSMSYIHVLLDIKFVTGYQQWVLRLFIFLIILQTAVLALGDVTEVLMNFFQSMIFFTGAILCDFFWRRHLFTSHD